MLAVGDSGTSLSTFSRVHLQSVSHWSLSLSVFQTSVGHVNDAMALQRKTAGYWYSTTKDDYQKSWRVAEVVKRVVTP